MNCIISTCIRNKADLLISGVVVGDVADCNLVLLPALLDVVLALGYLVLQLPYLQHRVSQWEGRVGVH